ncbi:putative addiction module antidote protein [Propionimicrobium lymphophilum]|uniref:addiction module antidote protein n=1 Tax=Propionimicrobium lymphophilum TaxID=33012 RepID=UPI00254E5FE5|nr:addiction module antidote protein [Propionimicrobium lymphophilum]MDK7710131.1 putative addiction module antidote protein [Propionimicrobium lymphophilum]MDK7734146.1 putative addiction module antidote protein [Propionimicrobium lymphophilum]
MQLSTWDASEYLETEEDATAYLNVALEDEDPSLLQAALVDAAKARGITTTAIQAGVGRDSLYKSLSANSNPATKPQT